MSPPITRLTLLPSRIITTLNISPTAFPSLSPHVRKQPNLAERPVASPPTSLVGCQPHAPDRTKHPAVLKKPKKR